LQTATEKTVINPTLPKINGKEISADKLALMRIGYSELSSFKLKYDNAWENKPGEFPHTKSNIYKVFMLDCAGDCLEAPFRNRISEGIEISENDFLDLISLLKDEKSFGNSTAACFDPKFGLVAYDTEMVPTEFLGICMSCNNFRTYPGSIKLPGVPGYRRGFSDAARNELREIFAKWNLNYYGYSSLWDSESDYEDYLENNANKN